MFSLCHPRCCCLPSVEQGCTDVQSPVATGRSVSNNSIKPEAFLFLLTIEGTEL